MLHNPSESDLSSDARTPGKTAVSSNVGFNKNAHPFFPSSYSPFPPFGMGQIQESDIIYNTESSRHAYSSHSHNPQFQIPSAETSPAILTVGNLPDSIERADLDALLTSIGDTNFDQTHHFELTRFTPLEGTIEVSDHDFAHKLIQLLNGYEWRGKSLDAKLNPRNNPDVASYFPTSEISRHESSTSPLASIANSGTSTPGSQSNVHPPQLPQPPIPPYFNPVFAPYPFPVNYEYYDNLPPSAASLSNSSSTSSFASQPQAIYNQRYRPGIPRTNSSQSTKLTYQRKSPSTTSTTITNQTTNSTDQINATNLQYNTYPNGTTYFQSRRPTSDAKRSLSHRNLAPLQYTNQAQDDPSAPQEYYQAKPQQEFIIVNDEEGQPQRVNPRRVFVGNIPFTSTWPSLRNFLIERSEEIEPGNTIDILRVEIPMQQSQQPQDTFAGGVDANALTRSSLNRLNNYQLLSNFSASTASSSAEKPPSAVQQSINATSGRSHSLSVLLNHDPFSTSAPRGLSRGFAIVTTGDQQSSEKLIEYFDKVEFEGRSLTVRFDKFPEFNNYVLQQLNPSRKSSGSQYYSQHPQSFSSSGSVGHENHLSTHTSSKSSVISNPTTDAKPGSSYSKYNPSEYRGYDNNKNNHYHHHHHHQAINFHNNPRHRGHSFDRETNSQNSSLYHATALAPGAPFPPPSFYHSLTYPFAHPIHSHHHPQYFPYPYPMFPPAGVPNDSGVSTPDSPQLATGGIGMGFGHLPGVPAGPVPSYPSSGPAMASAPTSAGDFGMRQARLSSTGSPEPLQVGADDSIDKEEPDTACAKERQAASNLAGKEDEVQEKTTHDSREEDPEGPETVTDDEKARELMKSLASMRVST